MASVTELATRHGVFLGRRSTRLHVAVYRRSGGRIGARVPGRRALRVLLLDHTGARSGIARTSPLVYVEDGDDVAIVASKAGQPTHPAWFHNLRAHPDTTIQVGATVRAVHARVATDEERARIWPRFVEVFPDYEMYQRYAGARGRTIPVVILERRDAS